MNITPEMQQLITQVIQQQSMYEKAQKLERFRRLNRFARPGQILLAGSSLMEQFPIHELLMDRSLQLAVYNRGVGGFTTTEMLDAMDVCVYDLKPAHIFLNIGTNDLNAPDLVMDDLMNRYRKILDGIHAHLPQAKLYLLAYYPVNPKVGASIPYMSDMLRNRTNQRIQAANQAVQALAEEQGAKYLDLNRGITDADGNLKAEVTAEGMHMYADGYQFVLDELLPVLQSLSK